MTKDAPSSLIDLQQRESDGNYPGFFFLHVIFLSPRFNDNPS